MDNSRTNVKLAAAAEVGWEDGKIVGTPVPLSPVGIEKLLGQGLSNKDEFVSTVTDYPPYTELWQVQRGDQPVRHYLVELAAEAPQMQAVEAVTTTDSGFEEWFNSELSGGLGGAEWHSPSLTQDEQLVGLTEQAGTGEAVPDELSVDDALVLRRQLADRGALRIAEPDAEVEQGVSAPGRAGPAGQDGHHARSTRSPTTRRASRCCSAKALAARR